jgi:hypothetical protein
MNKTLLNPGISWLFMVVVSLLLPACQGGEENGTATVRLSFNLSSSKTGAAKISSAPAPAGIKSVRIDVTGPEMDPLSTSVEVDSGGETIVRLEVPAGPARRFVVTAFDIEGIARYLGEEIADLVPGASVNLTIEMVSLVISPSPTIQISPDPAVVAKDQTQTFSVTGIDPSQIQFEVTSDVGNDPERVGRIAVNGAYTPPAAILTDGSTPIGNPIPVTVTASDKNTPTVRDSATVTLTTGSHLTFQKNEPVTPESEFISTGSSGQRRIAFHQGRVYAVWSNGLQILFSETADGVNWSTPPIKVTSDDRGVASPSLAVSREGSVYVAYVVCPDCGTPTIELSVRPSSGGDFVLATPSLDTRSFPQDPTVAVSPDGVAFVAWSDNEATTGSDIYLQRIPIDRDSRPLKSDNRNANPGHPAISISDSGKVFLAWEGIGSQRQEIFATVSEDGGENFSKEIQISTTSPCCVASNPTLVAGSSGTAYVAWEDDRNSPEIAFIFLNTLVIGANGLIAGNDKPLGNAKGILADEQRQPSIALDQTGGIYIAFNEIYSGFDLGGIFLAKSIDGGETFSFSDHIDDGCISTRCDPTLRDESFPSLAVDSAGRAFSIWTDGRRNRQGLYDVFFSMGE